MDRAIPEINRIIVQRQVQQNKAFHRIKLRSVNKTINNDPPVSLSYPINKKNKEQMVEGNSIL
jgi:hypothetical protein